LRPVSPFVGGHTGGVLLKVCEFLLVLSALVAHSVARLEIALVQARWHGATVAVKILRRSDEVGLGDFRTELNVLQKVR
jgi:hypothetical protein